MTPIPGGGVGMGLDGRIGSGLLLLFMLLFRTCGLGVRDIGSISEFTDGERERWTACTWFKFDGVRECERM